MNRNNQTEVIKSLAIIPARYASTRFPAKPLVMLDGKMIIERVYRQAKRVFSDVIVATDDQRIIDAVESFGGYAVMTSSKHQCGTDRCYEALQIVGGDYDIVVNVQGDEPFVRPEQLKALVACFEDKSIDIATLVKPFTPADGLEALQNPNSPKVVLSKDMRAMYFSRSVIPYMRDTKPEEWLTKHTYYKHLGLFAFRAHLLAEITALEQTPLELTEKLEQLRWLENGYRIGVAITEEETVGIDTPEDLCRAEKFLASHRELFL